MKGLASVALLSLTLVTAQPSRATIEPSRIFSALGIQQGQTAGEIGAGDGELSIEAARLVGEGGRVFTSELGDERVRRLERAIKTSGHANLTVVAGDPNATNFPDSCCDAIFMRNVYHHFADPARMNASIFRSLRPGGRLGIVDFEPGRGRRAAERPEDRARNDSHGTTADTVARELKDAGFEIVDTAQGDGRWFMVVAARPAVH
jgi:SAM-dependent methyltransferase